MSQKIVLLSLEKLNTHPLDTQIWVFLVVDQNWVKFFTTFYFLTLSTITSFLIFFALFRRNELSDACSFNFWTYPTNKEKFLDASKTAREASGIQLGRIVLLFK